MDFGILSRKYRVGYYSPNNKDLKDCIKDLTTFEHARNGEEHKQIQIELIDLSDPSKFDEFNYQCDTIIFDTDTLCHGTDIQKLVAKNTLQHLIETNQTKYNERGDIIHDSAKFISIYHKKDFSSIDENFSLHKTL